MRAVLPDMYNYRRYPPCHLERSKLSQLAVMRLALSVPPRAYWTL